MVSYLLKLTLYIKSVINIYMHTVQTATSGLKYKLDSTDVILTIDSLKPLVSINSI
jgi:hypothetical protein